MGVLGGIAAAVDFEFMGRIIAQQSGFQ